jgi:hypothetical protein
MAGLDPRVMCSAPSDGDYLVRMFGFPSEPDASITLSGSDRHVYRLTLTTGPLVEHTLPSAIQRSQPNPLVRVFGRTIADPAASLAINPQADSALETDNRSVLVWHPEWPGAMPLAVVEHPSILIDEASSAPREISVPVSVSGRLEAAGDVDSFRFPLKKNEKLRVTLQSRAVGAGLYPAARIVDPSGKTIANYQADSTERDFSVVFTAPEDAAYVLHVSDAGDAEGEQGFYRLTLEPVVPEYSPSLSADSFVLAAATPLEIPVTVGRSDGFAEPIEFRLDGLPEGVTAEPAVSHEGESAKQIKLILKADPSAAAFNGPLVIRGKSTGPLALERTARYGISLPGAGSRTDVWLTVKK